jgi:hypothetical protein
MIYNFIMKRGLEFERSDNIHKGWIISKKYAEILLNNKNNKNIHSILHSSYGEYLSDLRSNHLDMTNCMKYNRAWQTLLNTFKNCKSDSIVRNAVSQFHYTCHINI